MRGRKAPTAGGAVLADALADPIRIGILERLAMAEKTAKELAAALRVEPSRLYYHLNRLVEARLIEVAGFRKAGRNPESVYRVAHFSEELDEEESLVVTAALIDATAQDVRRLILTADDVDRRRGQLRRVRMRLTEKRFDELKARMNALLSEYEEAQSPRGFEHILVLVAYPDPEQA
jgi:DNA-binding transcriptional ArsR family regulator